VSSYDDIAAPGWPDGTRIELWERLHEFLDDGTGRTPPQLQGLLWDLVSMPEPDRGLTWLRNNPTGGGYLRGLARGDIPLTHDALQGLPSWRAAAHLRDLLMAAGALPSADRQILLFERWYRNQLQAVSDPRHEQLLRQFVTWHLLPRMRAKAARRPLSAGSRNAAANKLTVARKFLTWLASQGHPPRQATQADVDTWFATRPQPQALAGFLEWAMTRGHIPRLDVPRPARTRQAPVSQHRRLTLLNRFLTDQRIPLRTRVAGCLLLLYAQPVTRLVRLTIHDVIAHESQVSLRLGTPPAPVPEPFAAMLTELTANRANMNTAANPACPWLFPGGRAGQPLTPGALLQQLRALGVPVTQTRTAAFRQLVLQAPAPVVAHALGYNPSTATKHVSAAGGTWSRYPAARARR
jgi:hypothetical protein